MQKVRVRFAPSPTGLQHLGNLRTALFNWLLARQHHGQFILRFEDTDVKRRVEAAETHIFEALDWLGLNPDEGPAQGGQHGPYRQSERLDVYRQHAKQLLDQGRLYRDWTTPKELDDMRAQAAKIKQPLRVRQHMLKTDGDTKQAHVMRFKIETEGQTGWSDVVHGQQTWQNDELDDFVAIKSDGYPTYNFANVIDDHLMEISHVLRGDEFLASTPKHLQIYQAYGWEPPQLGHLPAVLGPDKTKLSKRHGARPALEYRELGYLREAVINFLALLGWHPGSQQEIFDTPGLIKSFSLRRLNASPAVFDVERLNWLNGQHIRRLSLSELASKSAEFWPPEAKTADDKLKGRVLEILQDRLKYLSELPDLSAYFFESHLEQKHLMKLASDFQSNVDGLTLRQWLVEVAKIVDADSRDREKLSQILQQRVQSQQGSSKSALWVVLRIILANGEDNTPPVWELIYALGKSETLRRLDRALSLI